MARIYNGTVSIIKNTKGEIMVKPDPMGAWSQSNVTECWAKMNELGKKLKAPVKFYQPDPTGKQPVLLYRFENSPFMALMKDKPDSKPKGRVEKLA